MSASEMGRARARAAQADRWAGRRRAGARGGDKLTGTRLLCASGQGPLAAATRGTSIWRGGAGMAG